MNANEKTFAAVIEERHGRFEISYHTPTSYGCCLPWDAHTCKSVEELAAKLADMAKIYGWTITSVQHNNRGIGEWRAV